MLCHSAFTQSLETKRQVINVNRSCLELLFSFVGDMFPKGPEPAFLSGTRDGVVENECGCTSHRHACWQKDRYYLVDFWNTFNIKTIPQHIQSIVRPRFSNEAYATKLRGVVIILGMRTAIAPRRWLPWRHGHDHMVTATVGVICAFLRYWPYRRVCEYVLPCWILILLTCNNIVIDKKWKKPKR